jgi:hypothetical protein
MDFAELYKPYVTKEAPGPEDQITWLMKNGLPQHIVDQAMLKVYEEIRQGKVFEADEIHTATWNFWMYLRDVGRELHKQELNVYVKHLESFHQNLQDQMDGDWKSRLETKVQELVEEHKRTYDAEWYSLKWWQKFWEIIRGRA